jgi:hypothetical protein
VAVGDTGVAVGDTGVAVGGTGVGVGSGSQLQVSEFSINPSSQVLSTSITGIPP